MPYITRDDGERFVIPSYRDVLSAKNKSMLRRDILMLSQNYGEYITLQKKSAVQYEVAFSPDLGYLLGESIWHYFKRPVDMIYCEAIPNTTEALLVIVKGGSVYLDGRFPIDSIPEELVIFLTQQTFFEIYISGDVPISQTPEAGKFAFEASSVKSFTEVDQPVFARLPLLKQYQLQPVDPVLKAHGIGVYPIKQIVGVFVLAALIYAAYYYLTSTPKAEQVVTPIVAQITENPYKDFNKDLNSPAPDQEIADFIDGFTILLTMPGWTANKVDYAQGSATVGIKSIGGNLADLGLWAQMNNIKLNINTSGVTVSYDVVQTARSNPNVIYPIKQIMATFIDKLGRVYPGNHIAVNEILNKGPYTRVMFTVNVDKVSPLVLGLIGQQFKDLPFVLQKISLAIDKGNVTGSLTVEALGSPS